MPAILIVGGYGAFGLKVAERLAREAGIEVILAGRSASRAQAAAAVLARNSLAAIGHAAIDAVAPDRVALASLAPAVIVNASGPFQAQDYALARAAISIGAHYIDLADARTFVTGITVLDTEARQAGVLVTSGASSVPAVAAAIVDRYAADFASLERIEHCITPANGYDPGLATTASILGGAGKPLSMWINGDWRTVHGWQGLRRVACPGLGHRLMADCDVPDLALFPSRYAGVQTVRFQAGLEVPVFQLGLWLLAAASRLGIVPRPERLALPLMRIKRSLRFLGTDAGGMFVRIAGRDHAGRARSIVVSLIARQNQGPYVPAIASVVLARKLVQGSLEARGAMPCVGLLRLEDFEAETGDLAIEISTSETTG